MAYLEDTARPGYSRTGTHGGEVKTFDDGVARCAREIMFLSQINDITKTSQDLLHAYVTHEREGGVAKAGTIQHAWDRLSSDMAFNASTVMIAARQHRHKPGKTFVYRYDGKGKRKAFHGW